MATIDIRLVQDAIRRIAATSQGVKHELRTVMGRIEDDPASFPPLESMPEGFASRLEELGAHARKAKVINGRHDFRLLMLHKEHRDRDDHVVIFDAFPRKDNYQIDWEWLDEILGDL